MKSIHILIVCLMIFIYEDFSFANIKQGNWRWRNDNGNVYTATWKDSLNTPVVITDYDNIRLRIENIFSATVSSNISISYTDDIYNNVWIPITNADTGKFFISPSDFIFDTISYFNNHLFSGGYAYSYSRTITFDSTYNYFLKGDSSFLFELEYSLKPTKKIQPGSAYFFSLFNDNTKMWMDNNSEYPVLMIPPINWITQSSGKYTLNDICFVDVNTGVAVGYCYDGAKTEGVILRTTDGGKNWINQSESITTNELYGVCFTGKDTGTVVGIYNGLGVILRTTNGGNSWIVQYSGYYGFNSISFGDANNGIALCYSAILKTTDGGNNWFSQSIETTGTLNKVFFTDAYNGTAVGYNGIILRTKDGGNSWITQSSGTTGILYNVYFTDANNGTAVGYDGNSSLSIILKTTNGGITWLKTFAANGPTLRGIYFANNNTGWVCGDYGWILKTTDSGLTWKKLVSGTSQALNAIHFVDDNIGWAVGNMGKILKTTNGGITTSVVEKESKYIPDNFYLSQNYPNPFNPSTRISWQSPVSSRQTLKIFDILGKEVATLIDEEKPAGTYEITWNARNLSSGVYFYQLKAIPQSGRQAGSYIETKKMILLR